MGVSPQRRTVREARRCSNVVKLRPENRPRSRRSERARIQVIEPMMPSPNTTARTDLKPPGTPVSTLWNGGDEPW